MKGELIDVVQGRKNVPAKSFTIEAFNGVDNKVDADGIPTIARSHTEASYSQTNV
jgi:hypothetical protein